MSKEEWVKELAEKIDRELKELEQTSGAEAMLISYLDFLCRRAKIKKADNDVIVEVGNETYRVSINNYLKLKVKYTLEAGDKIEESALLAIKLAVDEERKQCFYEIHPKFREFLNKVTKEVEKLERKIRESGEEKENNYIAWV